MKIEDLSSRQKSKSPNLPNKYKKFKRITKSNYKKQKERLHRK